ncbi:site-specific DNA-methyltransferase [Pendulispora rubella]|uniref:site-specific DNA-methyltransferase (adenine-specific) n=1 Tax=Pendulispora rubella TaxID=2741070 RepID=A0ABZ2LDW9_9BACT
MTVRLIQGDALDIGTHLATESVDLAYLDPPFAVGVTFRARAEAPGATLNRESGEVAYHDRWPSLEAYLAWLEVRLERVRDVLSLQGTLWLHLDQRAVHEAKVACDRVFGRASFLGEVIWVPGNGSKKRRGPGMSHQTILLYTRGKEYVWNAHDPALRAPFASTSLAMHFKNTDEQGRSFRERTLGGKTYRYYADEGRAIGSVWSDCPAMVANTPLRKESTGYPTQKPLKLLERIVRASSVEGSLVLDPFCGSGTTLHAAAMLGRRAVGSDMSDLAIATTRQRLSDANIPVSIESRTAPHAGLGDGRG